MVRLASVLYRGQVKLVAQIIVDASEDDTTTTTTTSIHKEDDDANATVSAASSQNCYYCDLSSIARNVRDYFELASSSSSNDTVSDRVTSLMETCRQYHQQQQSSSSSTLPPPPVYLPGKDCQLLAPINGRQCSKFLCIGMNYVDHCHEVGAPIPTEPVVFGKFPSTCIIGPNTPIVYNGNVTSKLDYEVELGIVIGQTVPRFTTVENAKQYIGGYTVVHDVSARDWQLERNGGQWLLGKSIDGYAPIGPVIVTTTTTNEDDNNNADNDEVSFDKIHSTSIRCRVNGEILQNSNTNQLVFRADQIIAHISKFITLEVGDIIATGTPPGVGCFRSPPRWLTPGDIVECEIDGIGTLTSPIVGVATSQKEEGELQDPTKHTKESSTTNSLPIASYSGGTCGGKLAGMTCLVTGAARGIGYGIASKFASEGVTRIGIVDLSLDQIEDACRTLRTKHPNCDFVPISCDVGDEVAVMTCWNDFANLNNGRIDILVQAAGIVGITNVQTENVEHQNFEDVFRVNVGGIFNGCKAVLPIMKKRNYGRIVNIASIAGKEGNAGMLAYSASKSAVIGLTKTIGKEYATSGITCNALAPAVVRTAMVEAMPEEQVRYMTDKIPMKRCGTIDEISAMVCFMASPDCSFTTGFCFDATGGRSVY